MSRPTIFPSLCVISLAILLSGCRFAGSRGGAEGPDTASIASVSEEDGGALACDTVFVSGTIPPEVEARMRGISYPADAGIPLQDLRYLRLSYIDFEGNARTGEMVCNKLIAEDLLSIFRSLYEARYPIRSIRLTDDFGGSDEASMAADNTSCFNYRAVSGGRRLSRHAYGMAVDINPLENPYVRGGTVRPEGAGPFVDRGKDFPHKIDKSDLCYRLFRAHGFSWGGSWRSLKDYQHFEK